MAKGTCICLLDKKHFCLYRKKFIQVRAFESNIPLKIGCKIMAGYRSQALCMHILVEVFALLGVLLLKGCGHLHYIKLKAMQ